jgi:DNA modification methylase
LFKLRIILKIGLYSIIYLKNPPYAVTDTCVELAKKLGKGGTAGFINAVLRGYLRNGVNLEEKGVKGLSIKYSYPEFLIEKLIDIVIPRGYGNIILDPFAGSGTTLLAAKNKEVDYIGIEINPSYIDIINKRLKNA